MLCSPTLDLTCIVSGGGLVYPSPLGTVIVCNPQDQAFWDSTLNVQNLPGGQQGLTSLSPLTPVSTGGFFASYGDILTGASIGIGSLILGAGLPFALLAGSIAWALFNLNKIFSSTSSIAQAVRSLVERLIGKLSDAVWNILWPVLIVAGIGVAAIVLISFLRR